MASRRRHSETRATGLSNVRSFSQPSRELQLIATSRCSVTIRFWQTMTLKIVHFKARVPNDFEE